QLIDIVQYAINTETHLAGFTARLQVDIRRALGKGVLQDPVNNRDDMLVISIHLALATEFQQLLEVGDTGQALSGVVTGAGNGATEVVELDAVTTQGFRVDKHHLQLAIAQHLLEVVLPLAMEWLVAGDHDLVTTGLDTQQ